MEADKQLDQSTEEDEDEESGPIVADNILESSPDRNVEVDMDEESDRTIEENADQTLDPEVSENIDDQSDQMIVEISNRELDQIIEEDAIQRSDQRTQNNVNEVFGMIVEETGWIDDNSVHAFKYKYQIGSTDKNKIAAFDLDGTLITPKSNNKFSRNINDWKLLDNRLRNEIKRLINDGYNFVIFSNQMGVSSKFIALNQIKKKFENIVRYIDLPCVAILATHQDKNRKPSIGMLEFYNTIINTTKLELKNSFFVGDVRIDFISEVNVFIFKFLIFFSLLLKIKNLRQWDDLKIIVQLIYCLHSMLDYHLYQSNHF